ncbi:NAD(P)-dependent oxidoreductase [Streptomyces sp. NRRL B-24085]|uniref:NAD(P)-dependent oxidoreductase n=1 Tax=Streptomyces sp. NRRL B-24085 TaxID=1709476 RepID=UPI0006B399C7|nr:NAD(P)-dependent oxidoreductase [Streptomyces sp. NRRL B-24085]
MSKICLIGVGRMGEPICTRLVAAGHHVHAYDIRPERREAILACGAQYADTALAAATSAEVLISVLPGPAEAAAAVGDSVLAALAPGAIWIDMTSNTAADARAGWDRAVAHGVATLEAPIGGSPKDAAEGRLRLYTGGDTVHLERCRPLLDVLSDRITHMGGHGAGYTTKLLVNLLWFTHAVATAETLLIGHRAGIDLTSLTRTLAGGPASSTFIQDHLPGLLTGDYLTGFGLDRIVDQLTAITSQAERLGTPHPLAAAVRALHQEALESYGPASGELAAVALLEELAGLRLRLPS